MEKQIRNERTVDLEGMVFGKLTVISFAGYKKTKKCGRAQWLCKCECGNKILVEADKLKFSNTKSCGCLKHLTGINSYRFVDLTKEELPNEIVAIKYLYSNKLNKTVWLFKCHCGNEFEAIGNNVKTETTKSCGCLNHGTGENNPNYNPNLTDEQRDINKNRFRNDLENTNWIKAVLKRDNYTCRKCGRINCYLEAHHLANWADNPKLRYDINNGITLCRECHRTGPNAFHKICGYRNTTVLQTQQFLNN